MENNTASALVKSSSALTRVSNQIAITNRLLEVADPFLIPYRKGNKWGFCDRDKRIVIECVYDEVKTFSEQRAAVQIKGKWGFISKSGSVIVPIIYDEAHSFSCKLAAVKFKGLMGYIDSEGIIKIPIIYYHARSFSDGLAWVIPWVNEEEVMEYAHRAFLVLNDLGHEVRSYYEFPLYGDFHYGLAAVSDFKGDPTLPQSWKWFYLAKSWKNWGNPLLENFDTARDFSEGLGCVSKDGKYGFIDVDGNNVIPYRYDSANSFGQGLAPVRLNGQWSYINKSEEIILQVKSLNFDDCYEFINKTAKVERKAKFGYISIYGDLVIPCIYDNAENFLDNVAMVKRENVIFFIDSNGTEYYEK